MKYARVGDRQRDVHRLLDEDDRAALGVDRAHHVEQLLDDRRRQAERQLVDDQQLRLGDERHAEREQLLLAAGQVAGQLVPPLAQPREAVEHLLDAGLRPRPGPRRRTASVPALKCSATVSVGKTALPPGHLDDAQLGRV